MGTGNQKGGIIVMYLHYIITSSSYSIGKRIALHYVVKKNMLIKYKSIVERIIEECGRDVSIATHIIETESNDWNSIIIKDLFFKNIELIDNIELFIKLIQNDRNLTGTDVAKYILNKINCTHLKLQKIVYMCYADYLCTENKKLFDDTILAYNYGPVISSVYNKYKKYKSKEIYKIDDENTLNAIVSEMPAKSRILFAKDGIDKITSINSTIEKYKNCSASCLVDITHRNETPWKITMLNGNATISDDNILKFHKNEKFV